MSSPVTFIHLPLEIMGSSDLYNHLKRRRSAENLDYQLVHWWNRQPLEQWRITRTRIFARDQGQCQSPVDAPPKVNALCQGGSHLGNMSH